MRTKRKIRSKIQTMHVRQYSPWILFLISALHFVPCVMAQEKSKFDPLIQKLMQREKVNGLAVAVIDNGQVSLVRAYGMRNVEKKLPLTVDTIMYSASLTKTAFAYMVMQLVDEGKLGLDTSIAELLPRPLPDYEEFSDLHGDERWRLLTPRILLGHTTGFANFRWLETNQKLQFHFRPGDRYAYSGEGYYIMQLVLEQGLGLDVGAEMEARVFKRYGMKNTSMIWRDDFKNNLADGYTLEGTMVPHDDRSSVSAAGSMDSTIQDQAQMWAGILRGDGLSKKASDEMKRPSFEIKSKQQFPTLLDATTTDNSKIKLSSAVGWLTYQDNEGRAWFKGGHNDSTGNMVVCLEKGAKGVVLMSNDVRGEKIFPEIIEAILGEVRLPWRWEYDWLAKPQ